MDKGKSTIANVVEVDFRQVFVLFCTEFLQERGVGGVAGISLDEGFLVIHDILIRRLLEPVDVNKPEILVIDFLNELKFLFETFAIFDRDVITHFFGLLCFLIIVIVRFVILFFSKFEERLSYKTVIYRCILKK